jgi:hypothetical protein
MRRPFEIVCFSLHIFCTRYPDKISCFGGPLRALRVRFHALLAVIRLDNVISCFLAAEFSFWWCGVRTVERWMLKDAGN